MIKKLIISILFVFQLNVLSSYVSNNLADYIIVVNSTLRNAQWENDLCEIKESEGLKVGLIVVEDANFANIGTSWSQKKIHDTLQSIWINGNKKLKYILLVGDANILASKLMSQYEHVNIDKNYASSKYLNFIPGPNRSATMSDYYNLHDILSGTYTPGDQRVSDQIENENGLITSDDFYGNFDGDMKLNFSYDQSIELNYQPEIIPEAAVGRIPVRNSTEMINYVLKLKKYKNNLTNDSQPIKEFQKNILAMIDNRNSIHTSPSQIIKPYVNGQINNQLPSGIMLNICDSTGCPYLFNSNGVSTLLTFYTSGVGTINELDPFLCYRTKWEPQFINSFRDHDIGSDDDILMYPNVQNGEYTILLSAICDRMNFDGMDRNDRSKLKNLINGFSTYYDGYYSNSNDLLECILLNPTKGPICIIGTRYNSQLSENSSFNEGFSNAIFNGECIIGNIYNCAKMYSHLMYPSNKSRNNSSNIAFGDILLYGDPAQIVNITNSNSPNSIPSYLNLFSDSGAINAYWGAVSGADGYSVSIGTSPNFPSWSFVTKNTHLQIREKAIGQSCKHNERYFITIKPYKNVENIRSYRRNNFCRAEIVLDKYVSPPRNPFAVLNTSNEIELTFSKSVDRDVKGYRIIRIMTNSRSGGKILAEITDTSFVDNLCIPGVSYIYQIQAIDSSNNLSIPVETGTISRKEPITININGTGSDFNFHCEYQIPSEGVIFAISNSYYKYGAMFTIRNKGLNDSNVVSWFGVKDQNRSNCSELIMNLFGNGAQINNMCTPFSDDGKMYLNVKSYTSRCSSIYFDLYNWRNGQGCQ